MLELAATGERTLELSFAGDTYNTAVYLRRNSDAEVGYFTGLGEDEHSSAMRAAWREESIVDRSRTIRGRLPGLYMIRTGDDGERSFTYWRDASAARTLFQGAGWTDALDGDLVHLSGITLQLTTRQSRSELLTRLAELRAQGTLVSFDTNFRPAGWSSSEEAAEAFAAIRGVTDILLASIDDETALHGRDSPEAHIRRLAASTPGEVVLRCGADGAYVADEGTVIHVRAKRVAHVVDTTAAGDSFAGAYLAARLAGDPPSRAAQAGNTLAGSVIQHRGAIVPRSA
ncbi:sugar kinase [Solirubrobacter taibaiensis]|nr:sugar kinase [Solirubrobacter taibaiensis]